MSYKNVPVRYRIDVSEGIEINKANKSKECMISHKFEPRACNKCHDISMTVYELKNIAILNVKGVDYRCI